MQSQVGHSEEGQKRKSAPHQKKKKRRRKKEQARDGGKMRSEDLDSRDREPFREGRSIPARAWETVLQDEVNRHTAATDFRL